VQILENPLGIETNINLKPSFDICIRKPIRN